MQAQIDKVSDIKPGRNGQISSKIYSGNEFFYINEDGTTYVGKVLQFDVEEKTSAKGNKYRIAHNLKVIDDQPQYANGTTQPWSAWETWLREVNHLLLELFPDELELHFDRAPVRGALFQSLILRRSEGKIAPDDEAPF